MRVRGPIVLLLVGAILAPAAAANDWRFGGHTKGQFLYGTYPEDSLLRETTGANAQDYNFDGRLKLRYEHRGWEFAIDYQFIASYGDSAELSRQLDGLNMIPGAAINDDTRWFNLTHTIADHGREVVIQRLDRLYVSYSGDSWVTRFGRQVVSWGNGMVFTAMDFFNPFDPTAVDKEYKTGDDMIYSQYLRDNGDDLQLVGVVRRDADSGNVEADDSTLALKYHGFLAGFEYDGLVAQHYDDPMIGVGGNHAVGGAIWRGDVTLTRTDNDGTVPLIVTSLSYSWDLWGKNASGVLEYFYNGYGISDGDYGPDSLAAHPELLERINRGELFTLARNYVVGSVGIEMTPLTLFTPNLFVNLDDPSAMLQLVGQFDLAQDVQLLLAANLPIGPSGSEYGGIDSGIEGVYLSAGPSLFSQIAWYF